MKHKFPFSDLLAIGRYLIKWTLLLIAVSAFSGGLVALFLWLLDGANSIRWHYNRLLWLLPVAGVGIHFLYRFAGKNSEGGNNLILEEIHKPGGGIPARMAPLVILSTIITHLFGGSAGREGTAIQAGGAIAARLAKAARLNQAERSILLMTGIAAGFGAVFGTPVAGAVFAIEVISIGQINYDALLPCLIAALCADGVVRLCGIHHARYVILFPETILTSYSNFKLQALLLAKILFAGVVFGLVSQGFVTLTHSIKHSAARWIRPQWLIPIAGGALIILLTYMAGSSDYLGLGVTTASGSGASIVNAFRVNGAGTFSWCWKLLFTAITLGTGFKGGEVTPLFFIGATLGNIIGVACGAPIDLMAGLGFIAIFAGATNTPIAAMLLGVELFGGGHVLYYGLACFTAYYFSGSTGIYSTQRTVIPKFKSRFLSKRNKDT